MYAFTKIVFFSDDIEYKVFVKLFPFGSIRTGAYKHLRYHYGRDVNLKNILNLAPRKLLECCPICCMLVVVLVFNSTFVSWVHPKQQNKHLYRLVELDFHAPVSSSSSSSSSVLLLLILCPLTNFEEVEEAYCSWVVLPSVNSSRVLMHTVFQEP